MITFLEKEHTFLIRCGLGLGQTTHDVEDGIEENAEQKGISISETFRPLKDKNLV